ncbi:MAG: ribonuclease HII [Methanosarcinales archaeon]|nr:ribonuclease HII [Methanosarcinales archaeon]
MLLLGIDEAGKGPVIGSMFVAGVVVAEEDLFDFAAIGVKDSKLLPPARREVMEKRIISLAREHYVLEVSCQMIDELRQVMTMNEIMVRAHAQVLSRLQADRAMLDASDVKAGRFAERVKAASGTSMEVLAEHKADRNHMVVAAASILAKVRRDRSIRELEASLSCKIGSGYPSDQDTMRFLENWVKENNELPPCSRKSWATARRVAASLNDRPDP